MLFTYARRERCARLSFGWLELRLPHRAQRLWARVMHDLTDEDDLVLLTNVPLATDRVVRQAIWRRPNRGDWRQRGHATREHGYRFDQEQGLDVEDLSVTTLERMRRPFVLVLLAAQFVCYLDRTWRQAGARLAASAGWQAGSSPGSRWPVLALARAEGRLANGGNLGPHEHPSVSSGNPDLWVFTAKVNGFAKRDDRKNEPRGDGWFGEGVIAWILGRSPTAWHRRQA